MKLVEPIRKKSHINLTALIDILFLLIIFFAVSTQFTDQKAIGLDLPKTVTSSKVSVSSKLVIIMRNEKKLFINGKNLKWEQVGKELKSDQYDRKKKVILNIDKKISHGTVVKLLDILKLNGFERVAFGTYGSQG